MIPFYPYRSGPLDELYPNFANLKAIFLHVFLIVVQATFLLALVPSLFLGFPVPLFSWTPSCLLIVGGFIIGNNYFCILLNGTKRRYDSITDASWEKHDDEKWVFINGVAVGDHWMQSNLDRLALTFRRPVRGIHNKTRGILFDLIEVIIQRTFGYATPDVREVYTEVESFIAEEKEQIARYQKVVLILHSQGAVEGGLVLDWLFAALNRELLEKLEIYTFGSAANHFNNPKETEERRVVRHIEHYANLGDYVSLFGILHFRPLPKNNLYLSAAARQEIQNRYVGRLFVRKGSGHQFNGNYLDDFFTMDMDEEGTLTRVREENDFMSSELNEHLLKNYDIAGKSAEKDVWDCGTDGNSRQEGTSEEPRRISNVSRLWCYRNGLSPEN